MNMQASKSEVTIFIRTSGKGINIEQLVREAGLTDKPKEIWVEGDIINPHKKFTSSGVVLKIFEGQMVDVRGAIENTVIAYIEKNQASLKLLKSKTSLMIFEMEFNIKKSDLFMIGLNIPIELINRLGALGIDFDLSHFYFD